MAYREDDNRAGRGHNAGHLAMLRKLTLIQRDAQRIHGTNVARRRTGWDTGYQLHLLGTTGVALALPASPARGITQK